MGGHILWSACLQDNISYNKLCFAERHVLLEDMFILRVCNVGGHVLYRNIFIYWRVCLIGSHVLHEGMSYRWTCLVEVHVV